MGVRNMQKSNLNLPMGFRRRVLEEVWGEAPQITITSNLVVFVGLTRGFGWLLVIEISEYDVNIVCITVHAQWFVLT